MEQVLTTNKSMVSADKILSLSVKSWLGFALAGQWAFAIYIFSVYAAPLVVGQLALSDDVSPTTGFDASGSFTSVMFFSHILPAILLAVGGIFQLVPQVRNKYPAFHRWNGRMFLFLGLTGALTGLYLSWGAGARLSDVGAIGITLNGILIPIAVVMAYKTARARDFAQHQRWAIHTFFLVNGVWTFRLFLMGWYMINQGPNGNTPKVNGPMDIFLSFACYLLPMFIAEMYFWARRQKSANITTFAAVLTSTGALITLIGVVSAMLMMWYPRLSQIWPALLQ